MHIQNRSIDTIYDRSNEYSVMYMYMYSQTVKPLPQVQERRERERERERRRGGGAEYQTIYYDGPPSAASAVAPRGMLHRWWDSSEEVCQRPRYASMESSSTRSWRRKLASPQVSEGVLVSGLVSEGGSGLGTSQ